MKIGISALKFNLEDALNICKKNKKISHIEMGIDNLEDVESLKKYKDEINKLNLSISIHLPMELNTCEDIKFIRNSWVDFICEMDKILSLDFDIKYYNAHLGYIMSTRLDKNRQRYLQNTVEFLNDEKLKNNLQNKIISIENTYSKKGDFSNVGNSVYDFKYIFDKIENDNVYFCYDTGHALIDNSDYEQIFDKIKIIHFSDNNGKEDLHIGYTKGILDSSIFEKIENVNPDYLILEINFDDIENTLRYF